MELGQGRGLLELVLTASLTLEQVEQAGAGRSRWRQVRPWQSFPHRREAVREEEVASDPLSQSGLRLLRARRGICGRIQSHTCIQYGPASWGSQGAQPGQSWSPYVYSPCPRGPLWSHSREEGEGGDLLEGLDEASCYPLYQETQGSWELEAGWDLS